MWSEGAVTVFNLGTQKTWKTKASLPSFETDRRIAGVSPQVGRTTFDE